MSSVNETRHKVAPPVEQYFFGKSYFIYILQTRFCNTQTKNKPYQACFVESYVQYKQHLAFLELPTINSKTSFGAYCLSIQ